MKKILILITMLLLSASMVMGVEYLANKLTPTTGTTQESRSITFKFKANMTYSSPEKTENCYVYTNATSSNGYQNWSVWAFLAAANNTFYQVTKQFIDDGYYQWYVNCSNVSNADSYNTTSTLYFTIDNLAPQVRVAMPTTVNSKSATGNVSINITAIDVAASQCILINTSSQVVETSGYISGTAYIFNYTGLYPNGVSVFNVSCNDTLGHSTKVGPYTITTSQGMRHSVDCVNSPMNNSYYTRKATLMWTPALGDTNFAYYNLTVNDSGKANGTVSYLITDNNTINKTLVFTGDSPVYWFVQPYDKSGNKNTTGNCSGAYSMKFTPSKQCSNFSAGWNVCAWQTDLTRGLSEVLTDLGATYVAVWNFTDNTFLTNTGTATHNETLTKGIAYYVYLATKTSWEKQWTTDLTGANKTTFTNASGLYYGPKGIGNVSGYTLKAINDNVNKSGCQSQIAVTLINQSTGKSYPYFCGYNESATVIAPFGSVVWEEWANQPDSSTMNLTG